jgi:ElaB/YqjD/DUF883 family membrane-anchored ribosome-binding protein
MRKTKLILLSLLLISCGTRKVNKSVVETKDETTAKVEVIDKTETTTNTEINTVTIDTSTTDQMVVEPINPLIEFVVNGKTYKNARITTKKVKSGVSTTTNEKVAKIEAKDVKTNVAVKRKTSVKVADKKVDRNNTFVTIGLIIGIGLVIGFFLWFIGRKFKKAQDSII